MSDDEERQVRYYEAMTDTELLRELSVLDMPDALWLAIHNRLRNGRKLPRRKLTLHSI